MPYYVASSNETTGYLRIRNGVIGSGCGLFRVLFLHLPGGNKKIAKTHQSECSVSYGQGSEPIVSECDVWFLLTRSQP
jgi:hypothetical protein